MGSGLSNEVNPKGSPFTLAKAVPPIRNPNANDPMTLKTTPRTTGSPSKSTSTPGFSFQLLSPNRHLGATKGAQRGKEEMLPEQINIGVGSSSSTTTSYMSAPTSRWNPTQEQLLALEDMYRRGMRTPTADQIQQIASQLQRFGKIEGKNVFYWFQNHKARERQKRRREGENNGKMQMKDVGIPGIRRAVQERHQHTKDSATSSICTKNKKGLVPMHGKSAKAENRTHGWLQFEERELLGQTKRNLMYNDTWQNWFCPSSTTYSPPIFHLSSTKIQARYGQCNNLSNTTEDEDREIQTLQLFPLGKENNDEHFEGMVKCSKEDTKVPITTINTNFSPSQFFEFLPLKN